ncbi:MAG: hypothetical protein LKI24_09595 [Acidipropionibacterium sp.]|jgi:hypothetical protein|nr:hypothetical protein [Acidipropionibacterium sp.]
MEDLNKPVSHAAGTSRRTILKGAAWTAPVVAAAAAVPAWGADSGVTPPPPVDATSYQTTGASVQGGKPAYLAAFGVDDAGNDAKIPDGAIITLTVDPSTADGTVEVVVGSASAPVEKPDGTWTIYPTPGETRLRVAATFPKGTTGTITLSGGGILPASSSVAWN